MQYILQKFLNKVWRVENFDFFSSVLQLSNEVTGLRCDRPFAGNELLKDMILAQQPYRRVPYANIFL